MYKKFFKRVIDIFLSFFGIVFLSLPMLIIAIAIKCDSKGPVFFKQKRVGIHKKHFNILKFRTMVVGADKYSSTTALNDPRITPIGTTRPLASAFSRQMMPVGASWMSPPRMLASIWAAS